jgi:hypothetical protein
MIHGLDPAEWSGRARQVALFALLLAWVLVAVEWSPLSGRLWIVAPLTGALIWRFERTRLRDIASWTVPLALVLLVAAMLPDPPGLALSLGGVAVLAAMLFSHRARDAWLGLVAPRQYRLFRGLDQPIAERLAALNVAAFEAIEDYTRSADAGVFTERLERLELDATGMEIEDPQWRDVRSQFVAWLRAGSVAATVPPEDFREAFAGMEERRSTFENAWAAIAEARCLPLEHTRRLGPPS